MLGNDKGENSSSRHSVIEERVKAKFVNSSEPVFTLVQDIDSFYSILVNNP